MNFLVNKRPKFSKNSTSNTFDMRSLKSPSMRGEFDVKASSSKTMMRMMKLDSMERRKRRLLVIDF